MGILADLTLNQLSSLKKEEIISLVLKQLESLDEKTLIEELTGIREEIPIPGRIIMSKFTEFTLDELRGKNYGQIRSAQNQTLNAKTKKQLIELEMNDQAIFYDKPSITYNTDGENILELRVKRDAEGVKLGTDKFENTFYPMQPNGTKPRDITTISELDANDVVISTKQLKHYTDGRQPHWL